MPIVEKMKNKKKTLRIKVISMGNAEAGKVITIHNRWRHIHSFITAYVTEFCTQRRAASLSDTARSDSFTNIWRQLGLIMASPSMSGQDCITLVSVNRKICKSLLFFQSKYQRPGCQGQHFWHGWSSNLLRGTPIFCARHRTNDEFLLSKPHSMTSLYAGAQRVLQGYTGCVVGVWRQRSSLVRIAWVVAERDEAGDWEPSGGRQHRLRRLRQQGSRLNRTI